MILALFHPPFEIGARRVGCRDGDGTWHDGQPYVLLRETTVEEWTAYYEAHSRQDRTVLNRFIAACGEARFFEVAMD